MSSSILSKQISQDILTQLGGNRLTAMTGAHTFLRGITNRGKTFLEFRIKSKAKNSIKRIKVIYNAGMDLYTVEFWKMPRGIKGIEKFMLFPCDFLISSHENVYNEDLKQLFESETGLNLTF